MALTDLEKLHLNHKLIDALKLCLVDKETSVLPAEGIYYFPSPPHAASTIGSIAAQPEPEALLSGFPPPPSSMGLIYLVIPDENGNIELSVSGQFDLEHAYIPDYDDMAGNLIVSQDGVREKQDVPEAFRRYTVKFENQTFLINTRQTTSAHAEPEENILAIAIDKHIQTIAEDPRVYRKRREMEGQNNIKSHTIKWSEDIVDQDSLNTIVTETLFDPGATPLPYQIGIECRYRRVPSLTAKNTANATLIELHLVNHTTEVLAREYRLFNHRVMDVGFRAEITLGTHAQMMFNLAPREYRYRDSQYVDGYGQACGLISSENNVLATESLPRYAQPWLETPSADQVGMELSPDFEALASDPLPVLNDLVKAMRNYQQDWDRNILTMEKRQDKSATHAREDFHAYQQEVGRVREGIDQLSSDDDLMKAFCLMNRTMKRAIRVQGKSFTGWRLFQIGFILTQLGSVTERLQTVVNQDLDCEDYADVLWFATGGGKTEAYMGLITTAMFYQRLKGRAYGVTAWLRFPLRMLSVQQFQRLSYVLGQANEIKVEEQIGGHPFTVGYFTGGGTPGRISSTASYAHWSYLPNLSQSANEVKKLQFINRCPHCGGQVKVKTELCNFRIMHVCGNAECWSNTKAPEGEYGEGLLGELGIYVSDEECYRYLPTVLAGTLDKAAVLGHNMFFDKFFGRATHYCPDHGFIKQANCKDAVINHSGEHDICPNNSRTSTVKTRAVTPMKDPGFSYMVTDELHLLGETLGNFDAHYESLLVDIQRESGGIAPKIIGATATIREYENHIHHLYLRRGRRFPVSGHSRLENFYTRFRYEGDTRLHRRLYVGMLPVATGTAPIVNVVADTNSHYHRLLEACIEQAYSDPAGFAVQFELDPSRVTDARDHLLHNLQPTLIYAVKNADADQIMKRFEGDNAERREAGDSELVERRLDGHTDLADIQKAIEIIEADDAENPIHELVATSVVSHGVDIERLNMEIFTGWPKSTAEYLQSSSRSGRIHPGIVMVGLAYFKLFEYSVYARFSEFHQFMDRLIEAVPINRFAPNVLSRTLPGLFTAVLFNWARHQSWGEHINVYEAGTLRNALNNHPATSDELFDRVCASLCLDSARHLNVFGDRMIDEFESNLKFLTKRMIDIFKNLPPRYTKESVADVLSKQLGFGPLQSFRDIEQQVLVESDTHDSRRVLASLSR